MGGANGKWTWGILQLSLLLAFSNGCANEFQASRCTTPSTTDPFDNTVLHVISIEVAIENLNDLNVDRDNRVPCDITIDGVELKRAGIRQKGGGGSKSGLDGKPSFSLKLDEFVSGQTWLGLDRLLLNNALQDPSLLNEHLAYELYRRAGLPAPRTAHAIVVLNRKLYGFYVMREAYDRTFLRRAFGDGRGNLYEGNCCVDFAAPEGNPDLLDLKHEDEGWSRDDLEALAAVVESAPDEQLESSLEGVLDLDGYLKGYAIDAAVANWDGFSFRPNNYYLYRRPQDGRFAFLPHGMDMLICREFDPFEPPATRLSKRTRTHPTLDARFREALQWVVRDVWDDGWMRGRAEQVRAVIKNAPCADSRLQPAIDEFEAAWAQQVARFSERRDRVQLRLNGAAGLFRTPIRDIVERGAVVEPPAPGCPGPLFEDET